MAALAAAKPGLTSDGPTANVLEVRNLSIRFRTPRGPVLALRNVNVAVPRGSVVGLVGESGSGKSTLALAVMRLMAGNATITEGSLDFAGRDLLALKPAEMQALRGDRLSMVFQDPMTSLNPVRAIGLQMLDIQYRERRLSMAEKRRKAADMLRRVGIPDPERQLNRYPHEFSGGMRQRIAIAMGILERPELLIADEPTTALDVTLEAQIIQLLRDLRREINASILFISHNLGLIAELCDFVVVLYAGEVVEQGTVRDIFHRPQHPYTQALLECDPARIEEIRRELPTISGDVPNLLQIPAGCVFAPRCPKVFDRCRVEHPADYAAGPGHLARCHLRGGATLWLEAARTFPPARARHQWSGSALRRHQRQREPAGGRQSPCALCPGGTDPGQDPAAAEPFPRCRPRRLLHASPRHDPRPGGGERVGQEHPGPRHHRARAHRRRQPALRGRGAAGPQSPRREILSPRCRDDVPGSGLEPEPAANRPRLDHRALRGPWHERARSGGGGAKRPRPSWWGFAEGFPAGRYPHQLSSAARPGASGVAQGRTVLLAQAHHRRTSADVRASTSRSRAEILNLMDDAAAARSWASTYLIITHNLAVLVRRSGQRRDGGSWYMGRFVEHGTTREIFERAAHPYTAGLLAAQPHPDPDRRREEVPLLGEVPSLARRPPGCEFHTRCPRAQPLCRQERPAVHRVSPTHIHRCHFPLLDDPELRQDR